MNGFSSAEATILQSLIELRQQFAEIQPLLSNLQHLEDLKEELSDLRESVESLTVQKDFYSTRELAQIMGVTQHTVQVRWCAEGRIECEKDPQTGHWRIPGSEYDRLRKGGKPDAR
jgi:DNA-directed RNA polymerase specialized sigma24 family protein